MQFMSFIILEVSLSIFPFCVAFLRNTIRINIINLLQIKIYKSLLIKGNNDQNITKKKVFERKAFRISPLHLFFLFYALL